MKTSLHILAITNIITSAAFSVKFFFVTPTLSGVYYGIVSWVCAFGFTLIARSIKQP